MANFFFSFYVLFMAFYLMARTCGAAEAAEIDLTASPTKLRENTEAQVQPEDVIDKAWRKIVELDKENIEDEIVIDQKIKDALAGIKCGDIAQNKNGFQKWYKKVYLTKYHSDKVGGEYKVASTQLMKFITPIHTKACNDEYNPEELIILADNISDGKIVTDNEKFENFENAITHIEVFKRIDKYQFIDQLTLWYQKKTAGSNSLFEQNKHLKYSYQPVVGWVEDGSAGLRPIGYWIFDQINYSAFNELKNFFSQKADHFLEKANENNENKELYIKKSEAYSKYKAMLDDELEKYSHYSEDLERYIKALLQNTQSKHFDLNSLREVISKVTKMNDNNKKAFEELISLANEKSFSDMQIQEIAQKCRAIDICSTSASNNRSIWIQKIIFHPEDFFVRYDIVKEFMNLNSEKNFNNYDNIYLKIPMEMLLFCKKIREENLSNSESKDVTIHHVLKSIKNYFLNHDYDNDNFVPGVSNLLNEIKGLNLDKFGNDANQTIMRKILELLLLRTSVNYCIRFDPSLYPEIELKIAVDDGLKKYINSCKDQELKRGLDAKKIRDRLA